MLLKLLMCSVFGLLLILQCGARPLAAQDDRIMAYTPTGTSCGSYASASPANKRVYEGWFLGWVSGVNYARTVPLAVTDSKGIVAWAVKYCAEHPLASIMDAGMALVSDLTPREAARLTSDSELPK
jgi:hypothetical protein